MKLTPSTRHVSLLLLLVAGVSLPQATSWKGMLQAQPATTTDYVERHRIVGLEPQRIGLTDFRHCRVVVERLPDAVKDLFTVKDVEGWAKNRLGDQRNMRIVFFSQAELGRAFENADMSTDEKMLEAQDRFRSSVYVSVSAGRLPTGAICANVTLRCQRGVFVHPGYFMAATVWEAGSSTEFMSAHDAKDRTRQVLSQLFDKLETDWKKCNP